MTHVHIALVGAQPIPIYLGIKSQNPDKVYFIVSQKTSSVAERVGSLIGIKDFHLVEFPPVDLTVIRQKIEALAANIEVGDIVSVNLVGGTKHWTIAFFDYFSKLDNAQLILVDQNNNIVDFQSGESTALSPSMATYFQLFDYDPRYKRISKYNDQDKKVALEVMEVFKHYLSKKKTSKFTALTSDVKGKSLSQELKKDSESHEYEGSTITWRSPQDVTLAFDDGLQFDFQSPNALSLVTMNGWLEYLVGELLSRWKQSQGVGLNCKMAKDKYTNEILNEFDVISSTGKKLLFIECKTQITKPTDIDKFANGVRKYGGPSAKGIFVTFLPIGKLAKEKLKRNKIVHFIFDSDNDQAFFDLIERIHLEINES